MPDKIEILSVDLLSQHRPLVQSLKKFARSLGLEFGWHYLLDVTWILTQLGPANGKWIMDGGAGTGVIQWYLASQGATVLSVDRMSRANLPLKFRGRFRVQGLREEDLSSTFQVIRTSFSANTTFRTKVKSQTMGLLGIVNPRRYSGRVVIYNQDLKSLSHISDDALDAVVAVSALEHNSPKNLALVVKELMRVIKPDGVLLATLGAARDQDWFHEPSHGWCYTDTSLHHHFGLSDELSSNYADYDELFQALQNCIELQEDLASFYFKSGDNGMPWGKWDPQYQPVGVCKVKDHG